MEAKTVAIDGVKILSFSTKHCEHCTYQTRYHGEVRHVIELEDTEQDGNGPPALDRRIRICLLRC